MPSRMVTAVTGRGVLRSCQYVGIALPVCSLYVLMIESGRTLRLGLDV